MKTIFESPNGFARRDNDSLQLASCVAFTHDLVDELERLQAANAKLRDALEAAIYHGGSTRDEWMPAFAYNQMRAALAETAP